jgi:chromosome partitioning protein
MSTIISFISQKGGVGKSSLARALAVLASNNNLKVLLADCDFQQTTSYDWTRLRQQKGLSLINAQVFSDVSQVFKAKSQYDLIIVDAPARTSQSTLQLARESDLLVQPVGASRDDLVPALREFNSLVQIGIPRSRLFFALSRISSHAELKAVQKYLTEANYQFLQGVVWEKPSYKQAQNEGKCLFEVNYPSLQKEALKLLEDIVSNVA